MTSDPLPISAAARHALEQELADVRAERETVAATLQDPDIVAGDRGDAADQLQRSGDLARLDARIEDITTRLRQADDAGPPPAGVVGVGSTVTVRFDDGAEQTVSIGEVTQGTTPPRHGRQSPGQGPDGLPARGRGALPDARRRGRGRRGLPRRGAAGPGLTGAAAPPRGHSS